jgi:tRNA-intron endonuclease
MARVKKADKNKSEKIKAIKAVFSGEGVLSNSKEAANLYGTSRFGEILEGKVHYSLVEALYLVQKGKMNVHVKSRKLSFQKFMNLCLEIDNRIQTKFLVFRDMRNRGYIVKTALKFGAEFRVYNKGVKPGEDHALWILYPVHENNSLTWHDFSAKNRVAHSTKKNLLIGIVDEEGDVTYYQVSWIKP